MTFSSLPNAERGALLRIVNGTASLASPDHVQRLIKRGLVVMDWERPVLSVDGEVLMAAPEPAAEVPA